MHLVGFIVRIYHDARSPERQIKYVTFSSTSARTLQSAVYSAVAFYTRDTFLKRFAWCKTNCPMGINVIRGGCLFGSALT